VVPEVRLNWEQFVGAKLFAWLGGLALFFAVVLGLKYSFDHNLIPPVLRAVAGYVFGAALITGGVILKRREYAVTAQTLIATGVVILYAVTFSCRSLMHLEVFTPTVTFAVMALVTILAFSLAVRLDAQVVAVLGMLGGFVTPVLMATGEDRPGALFSYVALLDAGLLAVVWRRRWDYLAPLAALGTVLLQIGWLLQFFQPGALGTAQLILLGFPGLFLGIFIVAVRRNWDSLLLAAGTSGLALYALLQCFRFMANAELAAQPGGLFLIAFGADLVLLGVVAFRPRLRLLESAGGASVFLLLGVWTVWRLTEALVPWALGLTVGFSALHTAFPAWLRRSRGGEMAPTPPWSQCYPALGLVLALVPLLQAQPTGLWLWIVILLVDGLAVLVAVTTGAVLGLALVIALTFLLAGVRMFFGFESGDSLGETLTVVGGFAVVLTAAGAWVSIRPVAVEQLGAGSPERLRAELPALSAALPFLLLVLVVLRFSPIHPSPVYGVAAVLVVLLLALVRWTGFGALTGVAVLGAGLVQLAWQSVSLPRSSPALPLVWALLFLGLLAGFPFVFRRRLETQRFPWIAASVALVVQGDLVLWQVKQSFPAFPPGLVPGFFSVPALVGLWFLHRTLPPQSSARPTILAWWGGVGLLGLTLIFPVQWERNWVTLGWALEGVALCFLFHRIRHPGLRWTGFGLLSVAFVQLTAWPLLTGYQRPEPGTLWNWILYTYGVVIVCEFIAARWFRPEKSAAAVRAEEAAEIELLRAPLPAYFGAYGTILAFFLVNLEIANYFNTGGRLRFEFSGNFARDMTYTIAWAAFALGLVVMGVWRGPRTVRYAGLALLGVALAKLFFHDLARLSQIYRIVSLAAVAVIALLASFLFQRFAAKRKGESAAESLAPKRRGPAGEWGKGRGES